MTDFGKSKAIINRIKTTRHNSTDIMETHLEMMNIDIFIALDSNELHDGLTLLLTLKEPIEDPALAKTAKRHETALIRAFDIFVDSMEKMYADGDIEYRELDEEDILNTYTVHLTAIYESIRAIFHKYVMDKLATGKNEPNETILESLARVIPLMSYILVGKSKENDG